MAIISRERANKNVGEIQVVEFMLGNDLFAVDLFDVKEVISWAATTPLPNSPMFIIGIINLRGEVTTIIDLKQILQISGSADCDENTGFVVLDPAFTVRPIGIIVDEVLSVSTYYDSDVDHQSGGAESGTDHIKGIIKKKTRVGDEKRTDLIIWLDIQALIQQMSLGAPSNTS